MLVRDAVRVEDEAETDSCIESTGIENDFDSRLITTCSRACKVEQCFGAGQEEIYLPPTFVRT